jgi:NAD(P)H dehydrogenase (quinone)
MIVITAASGQLGRLTLDALLDRGVPAAQIRAVVRDRTKVAGYAERGVEVVEADYADPAGLAKALAGADKYLLISSVGAEEERVAHHANAVAAAKEAGVGHVVYTSIVEADTNPIGFSWVHADTEKAIEQSGLPFTILRNNWYFENATAGLGAALEHGALIGSAGEGRIGYAARADYAAAAAVVLTGEGHEGKVYELTGDTAITQADLAAEVTRQSGTQVGYVDLPQAEYHKALAGFGLPEFLAAALSDADVRIAGGALAATTGTLSELIGRPTTTVAEAVAQALGN